MNVVDYTDYSELNGSEKDRKRRNDLPRQFYLRKRHVKKITDRNCSANMKDISAYLSHIRYTLNRCTYRTELKECRPTAPK